MKHPPASHTQQAARTRVCVGVKVHNTFRHADIVVVADPASYEGQHAIYEAMGNGAIIVANKRWVRNAGVDVRF